MAAWQLEGDGGLILGQGAVSGQEQAAGHAVRIVFASFRGKTSENSPCKGKGRAGLEVLSEWTVELSGLRQPR